ncbi:DUF3570 domain-containing protein [Rhizobacter sp. OV335]|uniref:DUF3570 domain-containing protein n=1 Tax=Rhizobacter sp. OV335 TaxID=1500264 RepID=UPI00091E2E1D|nr:DUF3570 domain-containing protein [Rhizobacter sp. OV335]SHN30477.1 Protein of unknown function [Rhizobacter sp. OV335]
MAATKSQRVGSLVAAAIALPGVLAAGAAHAEDPPEHGLIAFKYLQYKDSQAVNVRYPYYDGSEGSRLNRITVKAPSLYLLVPMGRWSVEGSGVIDDVSGATPRYYSDVSGASRSPGMEDKRKAGDLKVTRYFERGALALGTAHSSEHDYKSSAISLEGRISTADNNTTFNIGIAGTRDRIDPVNEIVVDERKNTSELTLGVTQALSPRDIAQLSLTYSVGRGYFDDPYKLYDHRPRERDASIGMLRWNHHFESVSGTLRASYRYYSDTFGIRSNTLETAWVQPVSDLFSVTPSFRYYTQNAASFYYDPVPDTAVYPGPVGTPQFSSADQRLSAFGGITLGLKLELHLGNWTTDLKLERYQQRSDWRIGGKGSPGIDTFDATIVQWGLATRF